MEQPAYQMMENAAMKQYHHIVQKDNAVELTVRPTKENAAMKRQEPYVQKGRVVEKSVRLPKENAATKQ